MQISSIGNSNFGARFVAPAFLTPPLNPRQVTTKALAKIKKISLDGGLSPEIYKKTIRKVHEIFPSDDYLISIQPCKEKFLVGVQKGIEYDSEVFGTPAKPRYMVGEFISTLRQIAERMAGK